MGKFGGIILGEEAVEFTEALYNAMIGDECSEALEKICFSPCSLGPMTSSRKSRPGAMF